jgi:hypothetical protein
MNDFAKKNLMKMKQIQAILLNVIEVHHHVCDLFEIFPNQFFYSRNNWIMSRKISEQFIEDEMLLSIGN